MLMKIKVVIKNEGEEESRCSADLSGRSAASSARRARCDRQAKCPLTRPAPAGESAGSGPPSPARGEGKREQGKSTLAAALFREGRGLRTSRDRDPSALLPRAPSSATADLRPLGEG
jgi:hypothetical protein